MILKMPGGRNVKVSHTDQAAQVNEVLQLPLKDAASSSRKATVTGWGRPPSLCSPPWQQSSAATF